MLMCQCVSVCVCVERSAERHAILIFLTIFLCRRKKVTIGLFVYLFMAALGLRF